MGSKTNSPFIAYAPIATLAAFWLPQGVYRLVTPEVPFAPLETWTILAIALALLSFIIGCLLGRFFPLVVWHPRRATQEQHTQPPIAQPQLAKGYLFLRAAAFCVAALFFYSRILHPILGGIDLAALRQESLESWADGSVIERFAAIGMNALACLLLLFVSYELKHCKRINPALVFAFLLVAIGAYARTILVIGMFIILLRVVKQQANWVSLAAKAGVLFILLFVLVGLVTKTDSTSDESAGHLAIAHAEIYFFGGVAGLNTFIQSGTPTYENSILSIPRFLQALSPFAPESPPPPYYDFVETPIPLNVFTSIYPPLHDFGLIGVSVLFIIYGLGSTWCCRKFAATDSYFWQVVAGFLLYSTAMSVFDDQFLRGLPVLLMFAATALLFSASTSGRRREGRLSK